MKVEFYEFFGFLRSRRPFPFFYRIDCGFCQQRAATDHLRRLHFSVRRNYDLHPDGSTNLHFAG